MKTRWNLVKLAAWVLPLCSLFVGESSATETVPLPLQVTPAQGSQVQAGQSFVLRVSSSIGQQMRIKVYDGAGTASEQYGLPPLDFSINVPTTATGTFPLLVDGYYYDSQADTVYKSAIYLDLVALPPSNIVPTSLETLNSELQFPVPHGGAVETQRIHPTAIFSDGSERNVHSGSLGTAYTTSNSSVATVNADGYITPRAMGTAFVRVDYRGLTQFVEVVVEDSPGGAPPTEYTGTLQIYKGGFRRDPATGIYTQQVTITNNTAWPIGQPIHLVLSNLPQGVWMPENRDKTRVVQPIGSPTVFVKLPEGADFLSPGASATMTLKFENLKDLPITYTLRVFGGGFP